MSPVDFDRTEEDRDRHKPTFFIFANVSARLHIKIDTQSRKIDTIDTKK